MKKFLKDLDDKTPEVIKCPIAVILIALIFAYAMSYAGKLEIKRKMADVNNTPAFNATCKRVLSDGFVSMNELDTIRKKYIDQ